MIRKFLEQRGIRKLRRDRMAMGALGVIMVYVMLALSILIFGVIPIEQTTERVAANSMPGAWGSLRPEQRFENAGWYLDTFQSALDRRKADVAVAEIKFAERVPLGSPAELLAEQEVYSDEAKAIARFIEIADKSSELETDLAELRGQLGDAGDTDEIDDRLGGLRDTLRAKRLGIDKRKLRNEYVSDELLAEKARLEGEIEAAGQHRVLRVQEGALLRDLALIEKHKDTPTADLDARAASLATDIADVKARTKTLHEGLQGLLDPAWEIYDEFEEIDDLDSNEDAWPRLAELEAHVTGLFEPLTGWGETTNDLRLMLGTDRQGRSIMVRAVYSIKVATQIGVIAALISVLIGTLLGGAAAFFGGWVDGVVVWLYSTLSSIPYIILLMVLASMFLGSELEGTLIPVYAAFCLSFWISPCRVVRGEVLKLKELEYVQAATAIGFGKLHILFKHVIPNTVHLMFINFSLLFIGAIKAEVILSFLGLGVKNEPSWGVMINQAKPEVINGFFWQIGAATFFMVVLVLAFNTLSDALQDAFDPKHVG